MRLDRRASEKAVFNAIMSTAAQGLGNSKTIAKMNSGVIAQSGHKISDRVHSIASLQNLRSVTKQYLSYVRENHNGRVLSNLSKDTMKEFLKNKDISNSSLNTYISTAGKLADSLKRLNITSVTREDIHSIRNEFKKEGINLSKTHTNRAYHSTDKILENIKTSTPFALSAKLQIEAGLRIDDATNSSKWKLNSDQTLTVNKSKNGLNYRTVQLDSKTANEVSEAIKEGYKIDKTEYSTALKEAVERTEQEFNGSHGLRYSFAQARFSELKEFGYTRSEALSEISLNMGHSREEISLHYLK